MAQPQTDIQAVMVIAFSLAFLAGMAGSIAAWMWAIRNWPKIVAWTGWDRDQPRVLIGIVDLVACFFCLVVAQVLILGVVQVVVGRDAMRTNTRSVPIIDASIADGVGSTFHIPHITSDVESTSEELDSGGARGDESNVPSWLTPILTLSFLLGGVLSAALVMFRTGASPAQIGLNLERFASDCKIGGMVFLLVTPVILVLSQIAISLTEVKYEHPVMDAMEENPFAFPFLFFGAVVCAPLWEEFVFRGLLIGWFDSLRCSGGSIRAILLGGRVEENHPASLRLDSAPSLFSTPDFQSDNPFHPLSSNSPPLTVTSPNLDQETVGNGSTSLPPWWPAIVSGVLFGLLHYGYGVSWIPLIVLGIVLGRIYQLRRSIVPVVVTHALFNSLSMLGLAVQILNGKG